MLYALCSMPTALPAQAYKSIPPQHEIYPIDLHTNENIGLMGSMAQDNEGYLWISTTRGIVVFDGNKSIFYSQVDPMFPSDTRQENNEGFYNLRKSPDGSICVNVPRTQRILMIDPSKRIVSRVHNPKNNNGVGASMGTQQAVGNTALGSKTLYANNIGSYNTAVGLQSLYSNTSGDENTATGLSALFENSLGSNNSAYGSNALLLNVNGSYNSAFGSYALFQNTNGQHNLGLGHNAGFSNILGTGNIFIGYEAGYNETGSNRLYISNSNADANNALLYGEFDNHILRVNGNLGVGQAPGAYKIAMKHGGFGLQIKNVSAGATSWELYQSANVSGNLLLYSEAGIALGEFNYTSGIYTATSDRRLKENIQPMNSILADVMKLQAENYTYIADADHKPCLGFIAQDVERIFPELVTPPYADDARQSNYLMNYSGFGVLAIKAIQEQQATIDSQEERISKLETLVAQLMEKVNGK